MQNNLIKRVNSKADFFEVEEQAGPIVFHHVPKTAGTTLTYFLSSVYGSEIFVGQSEKVISENLERLASFRFVSGHVSNSLLYGLVSPRYVMTLVRDPIQRAVSQYHNWRDKDRIQYDSPAWQIGEKMEEAINIACNQDAYNFLMSNNEEIVFNTRNVFVRAYCTEVVEDPYSDDPRLVEDAFENTRQFLWYGFTDRYEESLALLAMQLQEPRLKNGIFEYHNVSRQSRIISSSKKRDLMKINSLDYKLMDLMRAEFDRRVKAALCSELNMARKYTVTDRLSYRTYKAGDDIFYDGWSYLEGNETQGYYRWCYANVKTKISLDQHKFSQEIIHEIEIEISAKSDGVVIEDIKMFFDDVPMPIFDLVKYGNFTKIKFRDTRGLTVAAQSEISIVVSSSEEEGHRRDRALLGFAVTQVTLATV